MGNRLTMHPRDSAQVLRNLEIFSSKSRLLSFSSTGLDISHFAFLGSCLSRTSQRLYSGASFSIPHSLLFSRSRTGSVDVMNTHTQSTSTLLYFARSNFDVYIYIFLGISGWKRPIFREKLPIMDQNSFPGYRTFSCQCQFLRYTPNVMSGVQFSLTVFVIS